MKRGQTPFTPAVGILLELHEKLSEIHEKGIDDFTRKIRFLAQYFRGLIEDLPLRIFAETPSNSCTAVEVQSNKNAYEIFKIIKDEYHIFVCPNGGELRDKIFRIGHLGNLKKEDFDVLSKILHKLNFQGRL